MFWNAAFHRNMSRVLILAISTVLVGSEQSLRISSKSETDYTDDVGSIVLCSDRNQFSDFHPSLSADASDAICCKANVVRATSLQFPRLTERQALAQFFSFCSNSHSNQKLNHCQASAQSTFQLSATCYFINDTLDQHTDTVGCVETDRQTMRWCAANKCEILSQRRCYLQEYWNPKHWRSLLFTVQIGSARSTRSEISITTESFDLNESESTDALATAQCAHGNISDIPSENCTRTNTTSDQRLSCGADKVLCLSAELCREPAPSERVYSRERYCPWQKVYCLDFEGCNIPDPVFVATLRPNEFSRFKCPLGLALCADRQTCSFIRSQNLDDERESSLERFNCTFDNNEILSKSSTCTRHSDCHWRAKCCSDGRISRCVSYNETAIAVAGENCSVSASHVKSGDKCREQIDCDMFGGVCCGGFCYQQRSRCSDGYLYCDVTDQCVDVANGSCGLTCPPPLGFCPDQTSCVTKEACPRGFDGGKAWIVMPSMTLTNGFTLEDVWDPLNYTKGHFRELLAARGSSGVGRWETFDPASQRWAAIEPGHRLTAQSLLRVLYTSSFGFAQLTVSDEVVQRSLIHFLLPAAEAVNQLGQTLTAGYTIPQGGSLVIDMNDIWPLRERLVNPSELEQLWRIVESKASMLDPSSPALRGIYEFKRNRTMSGGWTIQSARPEEMRLAIQFSTDQGRSWSKMDASRPTSFADGEFRLRLSAQSAGRFQLHLTPFPSGGFRSPNKIDITVDVTPANCAPEIVPLTDSDRLPTVRWNGSNQGLRVSDLASHFYQTCGSSLLHLVVVSAANSSLGRWQWSPNDGDDWTDMIVDVNSSGRVVSRVSLMGHLTRVDWDESILSDALVIPAKHRLRFVPHSSGRQWTRREAMSSARIVFTASVSRSEQEAALRNVSYFNGDQDLSVSRQLSIFYMEFSDCSGHSSDQLKMPDLCGICGGDNSTCSQCATPETECGRCRNVTQMTTRDCAFQCQPLNEIKGSVCVAKTNPLALAHCKTADGEFLNKCGYCVTESDPLLGMNPCGTCSPGPNGPCSPCSRLAGGQCTWSHSWDDGKRPLMDWRPSKIDLMYGNRHTVSIRRAVIPTPPATPSCRLSLIDRPQGGNSSVLNTFSTYGALWLVVQVHDPGAYSVTCTWSVNGTTLTRSGQLNVIDSTLSTAVAEISPRRVPVATTVVVNVTRRSSVNITHGLRCIYQQSGHATFTVAASGVYGDVVACQLTLGYAVVTHLGLVVGEFPRSATIDRVPGLALQVRAQAPRIVSSALSRSLDHVSISFDQNVEGTSHCPDLFESASLALMGRDFSCTFHGNRLTLSLGLNHHMCPGSRLSFRSPAPIRRQGSAPELASSFQGTDVSVQLTEQILIDPIVILGPNSICPDEIALYRVGGLSEMRSANATFTWQLVKSNKSVTIATGPQLNVLLLNSSLIDSGLGNQLTLQVDLQLCGRTYSLSSSLNVQISAVLSVGITGPSRVYLDRHYFFTASVSTCRASVGLVNYQWSANGTAVASRLNAARIDLPRLLSSRSFYRLTCFVYASDDLNTNGQAEFNFYVDETAIAARISPTAQVVGYDGFTLDGSWSEDTANIPSTRLQFIWRCQRSDGGGCYVARRGPLERLEQLVGLIDLQKPVLRIADVLPPANYTFTLALYKGLGHFSEANATVVVVARNYPQITISDAEGHFVGARVQCSSPCCAYWTVDQETGTNYELIDDASLNSRSVYKPSRFSVPLEIPEFTKRLRHSEMRFRFKLSVKDLETSELTAQATVELLADSNPSGGNFTAESIESLDGLPSVKFKAENWTDQQQYLPLTYRFGYRLVKTNIWLTVMSYENSASLAVPFLTKQNVVPLVTICNAKLLCTQAESRAISVGGGAVQFATVLKESATAVELGHHHAALSLLHSSLVSMGRSFKLENDSRNWILDAVIEPGLLRYKQTRFYDEDQFATREAVQFLSLAFDVMVDAKMVLINAGERILETLEAIDRISRQENRVQRGHLRITNRRSGIPQIDLDRVILGVRLTEWLWMSPTTPKHAKARIMTDLLNYATCCGRRSKTTSVQTESIGLTSRKILLQSDSPHLIPTNETSHSLAYVDLTSIAIGSDNGAICLKIIETKLAPSSQVIRGDSWTRISSAVLIEATDLFGHSENELIPINGVFSASSVQLNSTSKFGCFKWDLTSDQWQSEPSCSATYPSVFVNSSDFVDCTCFRRGFHAVFVSQLVAPRSVWAVRMKIVNDFHETVGQRKVELTDYLLDQLSLILNISVQQFEAARLDRETMLFSFNIAALDETFKVERAFGLLTEFLGSGTLQLMDLNGRLLNIPPQTVDGLLITRDLGLIIFFVALCSFSVMAVIGFVVYNVWRRSNVVAPLKIPSPKSYLYPNSFSNDLSAFQMARPPEDLMFRCKDDLHESKL